MRDGLDRELHRPLPALSRLHIELEILLAG